MEFKEWQGLVAIIVVLGFPLAGLISFVWGNLMAGWFLVIWLFAWMIFAIFEVLVMSIYYLYLRSKF